MSNSQGRNLKFTKGLRLSLAALFFSLLMAVSGVAQSAPQPRREQLLNGLKVLFLNRPNDREVYMKLRVHSGAAFDLAGKEGLMALLGDAMFDAESRRFVDEDLEGRLEVEIGYDSLDVTLAGKTADFNRLLELLRNGLINTQFTAESVEQLKAARVERLKADKSSPFEVADREVAARLFHPHPYGRVVVGTPEAVARVDHGDMMLMRERFISPNNSTLVIVGNLDQRRTMRALRQALGGWRMSDRIIPSTFRQPEAPDPRVLVVNRTDAERFEVRLNLRGLARTDRDRPAAQVLAELARERWKSALASRADLKVRHEAFQDGGSFLMSASAESAEAAAKALDTARTVLKELTASPPSPAELAKAKEAVTSEINKRAQGLDGTADTWLDSHTYKNAPSPLETAASVHALSPTEVERVADRLFLHTPSASVAVGDAGKLREELSKIGGVEIQGETQTVETEKKPEAARPPAGKEDDKPALRLKRPRR